MNSTYLNASAFIQNMSKHFVAIIFQINEKNTNSKANRKLAWNGQCPNYKVQISLQEEKNI